MKLSLSPELIAAAKLARNDLKLPVPRVSIADGVLEALITAAGEKEEPRDVPAASRVGTFAEAAKELHYSVKHVRYLAKTKRIPTIGEGRSARVLIDEAIEALRSKGRDREANTTADAIENAGAAFARRGRLRAV